MCVSWGVGSGLAGLCSRGSGLLSLGITSPGRGRLSKIKATNARTARIQKIRKIVNTHVIFFLLTTWDLLRSDGGIFKRRKKSARCFHQGSKNTCASDAGLHPGVMKIDGNPPPTTGGREEGKGPRLQAEVAGTHKTEREHVQKGPGLTHPGWAC